MIQKVFSFLNKAIKRARRELLNIAELLYYTLIYRKPNIEDNFELRCLLIDQSENLSAFLRAHDNHLSDAVDEKIKHADLICDHVFDILNSGPCHVSREGSGYFPIEWHTDFKSNYKWDPSTFFKFIKIKPVVGEDIKVPWELSYFHHLTVLGQAYVLTKENKYAKEFEYQVTDWIDNNKVGFGVGWVCSMIIAIRVINWFVALEFYSKDNVLSNKFLRKIYSSIYEHGKFIRGHLENTSGVTTNHYLFNLAGLYFISVYCPFFKESKMWEEFAMNELCLEMEKQIYPDGCNFEASTSYHRFVLEMFFYVALLGERAGINLPENWRNRLKKMFVFTLYCLKSNGGIPLIGDNDSGRFLRFSNRPDADHVYLLSLAAIYFRDSCFKRRQFALDEEACWIFGEKAKSIWDSLPYGKELTASQSFSDAGWYIIRYKNDYCFISCGPNGQGGKGGHAHNDKLSIELVIDGLDIIVDPGVYVYTSYPEIRNKYRSTEYHNTVKFERYEQNEIPENDPFTLSDRVQITSAELMEEDNKVIFQGEIQYAGILHRRKIVLNKDLQEWKITDSFSCPVGRSAKLQFHLSPDVTFNGKDLLTRDSRKRVASLKVEGLDLTKDRYDYSPEYGMKIDAEKLTADLTCVDGGQLITEIRKAC